jgi:uncharacterized protein involved in outer membrane biogenesis
MWTLRREGQVIAPDERLPWPAMFGIGGPELIVILTLAAGVLVVVALIAVIPFVASTQIVRDRIAFELSALSGYRVSMGRAPEITVWPTFGAHLEEVQLREWGSGDGPPVMEAERVEIDMRAVAVRSGRRRGGVDAALITL